MIERRISLFLFICAESFSDNDHLNQIIEEAQDIVNDILEIKGQIV